MADRRMKRVRGALIALLALGGLTPPESSAQVFLASEPHPDFTVGPLFLIAAVRPDRAVTVNLSFSLTPRPGVSREAMEQDLFPLWPAEVAEARRQGRLTPLSRAASA